MFETMPRHKTRRFACRSICSFFAAVLGCFALTAFAVAPRTAAAGSDAPTLTVGHVGHDHHTPLYVALDHANDWTSSTGLTLETVAARERYVLRRGGETIANLRLVQVGGGAKMPTAVAQGVIEVGLGGVGAVLAAVDQGAPLKLVAPLHSKGDMLAVAPDFPATDWASFIEAVKASEKRVRVGYKDPGAVAKIVLEEALKHEGISFTSDAADADAQVHLVNVQGGGRLNVAISQGLVEAYAGNNPFPAIGADKGLLRVVADLEDLPPGTFRDHPCCCVAAGDKALAEKGEAITALLSLMIPATELINKDLDAAAASAATWIGTSEAVEKASIPTSGYAMEDSEYWHGRMAKWIKAMNGLDIFNGELEGLDEERVAAKAYDFTPLHAARDALAGER